MIKKWIKRSIALGAILAGVLILAGIITACNSNNVGGTTEQVTKKAIEENKQNDKPAFDKTIYDNIKVGDQLTGMGGERYDDVVALLGEPSTKSESQSGSMKMIMATWDVELGKMISLTFTEGHGVYRVTSKSSIGF